MFSRTASYYDKLYAGKDYVGEVARLIAILGIQPDEKQLTLLDVACGTGRHIQHLCKHFDVEGLDICPELLDIARARNTDLAFHLGDMTRFELGKQFDIVTCLFSSIGYVRTLDRLGAAMCSMAKHLKPGGVLVVEPWFTPETWHADTVHSLYVDEAELKVARISTSLVKDKMSVFDLHHLIGTTSGTEQLVEHHELGLFEVDEMTSAIERAGLRAEYDPGGLTGRGLYLGSRSE